MEQQNIINNTPQSSPQGQLVSSTANQTVSQDISVKQNFTSSNTFKYGLILLSLLFFFFVSKLLFVILLIAVVFSFLKRFLPRKEISLDTNTQLVNIVVETTGSTVIENKPKESLFSKIAKVIGIFLLIDFIIGIFGAVFLFYYFFGGHATGRSIKRGEVITTQSCGSSNYIVRKWTQPNFIQAGLRDIKVTVQKEDKSFLGMFKNKEFILAGEFAGNFEDKNDLLLPNGVYDTIKPTVLWDDGTENQTLSQIYVIEGKENVTTDDISCLQTVIPKIKKYLDDKKEVVTTEAMRGTREIKIGSEFSSNLGLLSLLTPNEGSPYALIPMSIEEKRASNEPFLIEGFSYENFPERRITVNFSVKQKLSETTRIYNQQRLSFHIDPKTKSLNIPALITYSYPENMDYSGSSTLMVNISYDAIINAMKKAKFDNNKTPFDLWVINKTEETVFASSTRFSLGFKIN